MSEEALREVHEEFPVMFTKETNEAFAKEITQQELFGSIDSMALGKSPRHDGIPVEFLKCFWPTLGMTSTR